MPLLSVRIRMPRIVLLRLQRSFVKQPEKAGAPEGIVSASHCRPWKPQMHSRRTEISVLFWQQAAQAMVRAASVQVIRPFGVGSGNGPAFIEKSANIPVAVKRIMDSKTFDNGTICASEQSIITDVALSRRWWMKSAVRGGYFMTPEESEKLSKFILKS